MWWSKKPRDPLVECYICKHMVRKSVCQERGDDYRINRYYCPMHRVAWDTKHIYGAQVYFYKKISMRINEDGSEWSEPKPEKGKKTR